MPPAARLTDMHVCPMVDGVVPHVGGPIVGPGAPTVLIGGLPAAAVGDLAVCVGPPDVIVVGSPTVLIGGRPAARMGDLTAHAGVIVGGLPTVEIGGAALGFAASVGTGLLHQVAGFGQGVWDGVEGMAEGVGHLVLHPVATAEALSHVTLHQLGEAITGPYKQAIASGEYGKALGRATVEIGSLFLGVGEAGDAAAAVGKVGEAADVAEAAGKAGEAGEAGEAAEAAGKAVGTVSDVGIADHGFTFRGDTRPPEEIFSDGFAPRGDSTDLYKHALDNRDPPSNFVSTSKSPQIGEEFSGGEYVYTVRPTNGIDVNQTLGARSPYPREQEIAIPDGIDPGDIRGATDLKNGVTYLNPNYKP